MYLFFKKFFLIFILLLLYCFISAISYSNAICNNIENNVFRLHVVANSDSNEDQSLKFLVRDSILEYINSFAHSKTKKDLQCLILKNMDELRGIAQSTINENGYDYEVTLSLGNFSFPTKQYGDITFPSGFYDALRVEIGEAKGQNWWCVMFPPLCFIDLNSAGIVPDESKNILETSLSEDEYALISNNSMKFNLKFKIVEFLHQLNT